MKYSDAIEAWGSAQLLEKKKHELQGQTLTDISVYFSFNAGENCLGCSDGEYHYCYAEEASAEINISGWLDQQEGSSSQVRLTLDAEKFDIHDFMKEVCEAAGGTITAE